MAVTEESKCRGRARRGVDAGRIGAAVLGGLLMAWAVPLTAQNSAPAADRDINIVTTVAASAPDAAELPFSSSLAGLPEGDGAAIASQGGHAYVALKDCPYDTTHARECRMHWRPMLISSAVLNAFQNSGNLYTGYWYRYETMHGKWWDRYVNSVKGWRWDRWKDNNPWVDDYIGHPMMGAITNSIWEQNDPRGMTLEFANHWPYWRSRLRATAWSTFYSFEWKLGPLGEAGIGHNGDHYFWDHGVLTNETGWVELVTTPAGGFGWNVAEDYLDKHVVRRLEDKSHNPVLLTVYQFMTPARSFANILRFRAPWYRDSRVVKSRGFWSDPGEGLSATTLEAMRYAERHGGDEAVPGLRPIVENAPTDWKGPGGRHELGVSWGLSLMSGHLWGKAKDVKYMPILVRYSYEMHRHRQQWALRYAPEMTAPAMINWPTPNPDGSRYDQRKRVYGSGLSPVGFQWEFLPLRRVQPFLSTHEGFVFFSQPVLSPQGSRFMYTADFGAGLNIYRHGNQAVTVGYRYQHLANGGLGQENPGTDANTFFVGISRFRSGSR